MARKSLINKLNLKNGLAFSSQLGDFVDDAVGKKLPETRLVAPIYDENAREKTWYRYPIKDGISGDGSEYHIYVRRAPSDKLCIFFSGGGVAWNEFTAERPVTGGKVVAGLPNYYWNNLRPITQLMNIHIGITESSSVLNPFNNWNFVIVTYATGDFHIGNNDFEYLDSKGKPKVVHFKGFNNFTKAMEVSKSLFPNPKSLLIAGDSAGAFAVPALSGIIADKYYEACSDITLFSDSGQLLYRHWKRTARDVWKADPYFWKSLRSPNITYDWYRSLYNKYGDRFKYLYASSTHDYLLSAYYNDVTYKKYATDSDVQEAFYHQLTLMVKELKELNPKFGFFINDFKNMNFVKTGLNGGTIHTAVRQLQYHAKTKSGISMDKWLYDAACGNIYDVGMELLPLPNTSGEIDEKKL